ncbi:MAG: hypothetical protein ACRCU5_08170, partial [Rhizobiaceae bacterium]
MFYALFCCFKLPLDNSSCRHSPPENAQKSQSIFADTLASSGQILRRIWRGQPVQHQRVAFFQDA